MNPRSEWIAKDVPELRIVDEALWQSVRERQGEITDAIRDHHTKNRLNGGRRPKSLLSGLIFCGCGGPYSLRESDRVAGSNHISKGSCSNSRTIPREDLERRVLAGFKGRMMAPEKVASLTHALTRLEERPQAAAALRLLIDRIVLTPGNERGEMFAALHGELRAILEWPERQAIGKTGRKTKPAAEAAGLSVSVVAGAGFEPAAFRL